MEIRIFGPLEVRDGERVLELGGGKQRALIADLAINRGEPLAPARLIEGTPSRTAADRDAA